MGSNLANFEGLIRGAIAAKRAITPELRREVYQSSRNALNRLIESNPALTVQTAIEERHALEDAINQIEAEFTRFAPSKVSEPSYQLPVEPREALGAADQLQTNNPATNRGLEPLRSGRATPETSFTDEPTVVSPLTAESPLSSPRQPVPTPEISPINDPPPEADPELLKAVEEATETLDEDPLAELKEILLEDADDSVRVSLGVQEPSVPVDPEPLSGTGANQVTSPSAPIANQAPTGSAPSTTNEPSAPPTPPLQTQAPPLQTQTPALEVPPQPQVQEPQAQPVQAPELQVNAEAAAATVEPVVQANPAATPQAQPADSLVYADKDSMPLEFARRRKKQKLLGWILSTLVVLVLIAWLGYYVYLGIVNGTLFGLYNVKPAQNPNDPSNQATAADYITIIEPGDLSALITANRGQAELVTELNLEMVRIVSVRDETDRSQAANPILLRLKPGVLEQISGKNVTFEIYAKSGSPSPAQFTVKCEFAQLGSCGRKRFRVGLQPEASIFAFDLGEVTDPNATAYIAISTDTTAVAAATGRGDLIDIIYARLRANN